MVKVTNLAIMTLGVFLMALSITGFSLIQDVKSQNNSGTTQNTTSKNMSDIGTAQQLVNLTGNNTQFKNSTLANLTAAIPEKLGNLTSNLTASLPEKLANLTSSIPEKLSNISGNLSRNQT